MKINKEMALKLWQERYGYNQFAEDFHGNLMCRDGYGDPDYHTRYYGETVYCGWNIHHILPLKRGGNNCKENLICTNIATNEAAADRITYWIDGCLYQVKKASDKPSYMIVRLV